jgi:hypothetical protein
MEKDTKNCYFCKSKIEKLFSGLTLTPEGWKAMRMEHERHHIQSVKIVNNNKFRALGERRFSV